MGVASNKKTLSLFALLVISILFIQHRISYPGLDSGVPLKITTWDAFGYYMYLPGTFIYQDLKNLNWLEEIDKEYKVVGSSWYQVSKHQNGNFVGKYFVGISILQLPYFMIGHLIATYSDYKADGFSPPYQYALSFGLLFFNLISLLLLRKILLRFFSDVVTAVSLLLLLLASNAIQYIAIENGMSHGPIFSLYVVVLYSTMRWHESPSLKWASLTGFIIGLASICRPTEAIMILIPILWNTHNKESAEQKWKLVRANKEHLYYLMMFGALAVLPQLFYWQYVTGFFIHDVGSAWDFLTPHFRVLFGEEKGWFVYTPVTLFFMLGMFFMKDKSFRRSVLVFCLINIYIVIAWRDWRYGGSYSTRALVQSYPVFALALAAFIQRIQNTMFAPLVYLIGIYLIAVNLFQIEQYAYNYLHYDHMNFKYYKQIYLKAVPDPIDASLLDTKDWIPDERDYSGMLIETHKNDIEISADQDKWVVIKNIEVPYDHLSDANKTCYLKLECEIETFIGVEGAYLLMDLVKSDRTLSKQIRLFSPTSSNGKLNHYASYIEIPSAFSKSTLRLTVRPEQAYQGTLKNFNLFLLTKK